MTAQELKAAAQRLRLTILKMFYQSKTGHMAPALSCLDILTVLYLGGIVRGQKEWSPDRDRVILSKGHACAALYAVLAEAGLFPPGELMSFYHTGSRLHGHPCRELPGIEIGTGSLGHGLCFATGTALAAKIDRKEYRTFAIIGDGESQEGSIWEAALFASNHGLDKLIAILDYNGLQAGFRTPIEPVADKWRAFGWDIAEVDGHDHGALLDLFTKLPTDGGRPVMIIARTVKGKGFSCMENHPDWHSRAPKSEELELCCAEAGTSVRELESI
ncbi:transketolase [Desulfovibrio sp. OttesenSCG-928-A18]|nr:transketolase [Desulfovibrio sp. OttesenSCG-928-A18]